jgi:hypothetical protein
VRGFAVFAFSPVANGGAVPSDRAHLQKSL